MVNNKISVRLNDAERVFIESRLGGRGTLGAETASEYIRYLLHREMDGKSGGRVVGFRTMDRIGRPATDGEFGGGQ